MSTSKSKQMTGKRNSGHKRARNSRRRHQFSVASLSDAIKVIQARNRKELPFEINDVDASISETSAWFHRSPDVTGLAVGMKYIRGKKTGKRCIQVFVRHKPNEAQISASKRIKPFKLGHRIIPTDVIRIKSASMHLGIGHGVTAGTRNIGSIGGFLKDKENRLFVLTAAHVLGESWEPNTDKNRMRRIVRRKEQIFDCGPFGALNNAHPFGVLFDRVIMESYDLFPAQNIDAAVGLLGSSPADLRSIIKHGRPDWPNLEDEVSVLGVGTRGAGASGLVVSINARIVAEQFRYATPPSGVVKSVPLEGVAVAEYESAPGDSGGMVLRLSDSRPVGIHIGMIRTDNGDFGVFTPLPLILGRWPHMRMLCS